jgi:hypothetical protein
MKNIFIDRLKYNIENTEFSGNIFKYDDFNINSLKENIKAIIQNLCKEQNINFEKQDYKISGIFNNIENNTWYSLCSKKLFNFFGKYYLTDNVLETFKNQTDEYNISVNKNDLVIALHHFYNKTYSETESKCIEFYVAPSAFVRNFKEEEWTIL